MQPGGGEIWLWRSALWAWWHQLDFRSPFDVDMSWRSMPAILRQILHSIMQSHGMQKWFFPYHAVSMRWISRSRVRIIPCSQDTALSKSVFQRWQQMRSGRIFWSAADTKPSCWNLLTLNTHRKIFWSVRSAARSYRPLRKKIFSGSGKHVQGISLRANPVYIIAERLQSMIV